MKILFSRVLNLLLWLTFCALAGTGLLLAFRMPPGSRGGAGLTALGMTRHEWGDWHTWIGCTFLVLIVVHAAMHWQWLWKIAAQRKTRLLLAGLGLGLVLLILLAFQPVSPRRSAGEHRPARTTR